MSYPNNKNNNSRPSGKEDVFNKIKFSSIKLGETEQGSPTVGLYLKREQLEKLVALGSELLASGKDGCRLSCIVIKGKDYDSGYAYINPKEGRQTSGENTNGQETQKKAAGNYPKQNNATSGDFGDKSDARSFFQSKRVDVGAQKPQRNS